MRFPPLNDTMRSVWRLKNQIMPFFLVNIILIGLIAYGLANSQTMITDEKKTLSYAEIALAFVGSFPVLVFFGLISIALLYTIITQFTSEPLYPLLFFAPIFIILNPFSLTGLRMLLQDKLSEQQNNIIAGITIPVAVLISYLTVLVLDGWFMD
jgi:hypothetical protein